METNPLVSVVLCTYNSSSTLPETIESVLRQSFTDFEFIVWVDGSTDDTSEEVLYPFRTKMIHDEEIQPHDVELFNAIEQLGKESPVVHDNSKELKRKKNSRRKSVSSIEPHHWQAVLRKNSFRDEGPFLQAQIPVINVKA